MAIGNPVLLSSTNEISADGIRQISFSRQDTSSFKEKLLQEIVDLAPEILPIQDFYRGVKSVCSLGREIPLDLGGERQGCIDNLLITNDGHLVIVETKLYRNPAAIREAVVQTLEYGMAVHKMTLLDLERQIRRGDPQGNRLSDKETIRERATVMDGFSDDFEIALERFQRTGELLLLVVADGIRRSVEQITKWMNEHVSSTPIKFGLVELRFYEHPDGKKIVVPKTLLMTKVISRHEVTVNIQNETTANVTHVVKDMVKTESGGVATKLGPVKNSTPPLTRESLFASIGTENKRIAEELLEQMDSIGLDQNTKSGALLRYGITSPQDGDEFLPLFYLAKGGVYAYFPKRMQEILGDEALAEFRNRLNQVAPFWTDEQMKNPFSGGNMVKYEQLKEKIENLIDVLESFKVRTVNALNNEAEAL